MISRLEAFEYIRSISSGRTGPLLLNCRNSDGEVITTVTKFSAGCEQGTLHLAREVFAACLAGLLRLPIPQPYLVEIPDKFDEIIDDLTVK